MRGGQDLGVQRDVEPVAVGALLGERGRDARREQQRLRTHGVRPREPHGPCGGPDLRGRRGPGAELALLEQQRAHRHRRGPRPPRLQREQRDALGAAGPRRGLRHRRWHRRPGAGQRGVVARRVPRRRPLHRGGMPGARLRPGQRLLARARPGAVRDLHRHRCRRLQLFGDHCLGGGRLELRRGVGLGRADRVSTVVAPPAAALEGRCVRLSVCV
mmetsp:Transcript_20785/g.58808  ORF Transcript_20785/g.58808 Transcript_20785/m.58808 type:complete len:215 (-) Transcript_20785:28-672(-)